MLQKGNILCSQTQNWRNTIEKHNQKNITRKTLNFHRELNPAILCISFKIFSILQSSFLISYLELRTVGIASLARQFSLDFLRSLKLNQ